MCELKASEAAQKMAAAVGAFFLACLVALGIVLNVVFKDENNPSRIDTNDPNGGSYYSDIGSHEQDYGNGNDWQWP